MRDQVIKLIEDGFASESNAYWLVAESYYDSYDEWHTRAKENGYRNPLIAPLFCVTCNWNENAHPRPECYSGFIPGNPEEVRIRNAGLGFRE